MKSRLQKWAQEKFKEKVNSVKKAAKQKIGFDFLKEYFNDIFDFFPQYPKYVKQKWISF